MTASEAADILGINRCRWELKNMHKALGFLSWRNTDEEEARRKAAAWAVRHWSKYQDECNRRRDNYYKGFFRGTS